jgi:CheY-like chemotaxis protein
VVEDEDAVREVTNQILTRGGYRVLTAANGPEALTILEARCPPVDLLLTDVVMPQMPGREFADLARRIQPGVRIVFMSGYTRGLLADQGVLESGIHLIEKPFDQTSLLRVLHDALG